jgi:beta-glucosidase
MLALALESPTFKGVKYSDQPDLKKNAAVARAAAADGMVLLKNEGKTLPLANGKKVAAFGNTSYSLIAGGTGSGDVNKAYVTSIAKGLTTAGFTVEAQLSSLYGQYLKAEKAKLPKNKGLLDPAPVIAEMPLDAAVLQQQAQQADLALVTIGRSAGEGGDRKVADDFTLTAAEQALLKQVGTAFHAKGKKMVVVLNVGGVIEVASWRGQADAILLAWQPGQEGGDAVADILRGSVTPSGKLATTFPVAYTDVPYAGNFPGKELASAGAAPANPLMGRPSENTYEEGVYVGYRYYNTFKVKPAYEFGYGLSYTTFAYGPLKLSSPSFTDKITASITVTNNGAVAGKEVVEVYVSAPAGKLNKPESELKAFAKTNLLKPGQSQTLTFPLTATDLASFDTATSSWIAEAGTYTVKAGASSLTTKQTAAFKISKELVVEKSRKLLTPQEPISEMKAAVGATKGQGK